ERSHMLTLDQGRLSTLLSHWVYAGCGRLSRFKWITRPARSRRRSRSLSATDGCLTPCGVLGLGIKPKGRLAQGIASVVASHCKYSRTKPSNPTGTSTFCVYA